MKKFIIILIVIAGLAVGLYAWLGGFSKVSANEYKAGPFHLVFLEHKGAYKDIGKVMNDVQSLLEKNSIQTEAYFGLYYDNPANIDEAKLRSIAGALVNDNNLAAAEGLIKEGKLHDRTLARQVFIKSEFPFKNMMSVIVGIRKVYPVLNAYSKDHGFPEYTYSETGYENNYIMEIYHKDKIEYLMTTPAQ